MGYLTRFKLKVLTGEDHLIAELRKENEHAQDAFNDVGDSEDEIKWYDFSEDMKAFSKKHPKAIFELVGEGEEAGDLWKEYFQNGKSQYCGSKITYDEFNPKELK